MSEQPLDLKKSLRTAWRHKAIISIATAIGLLAGAVITAVGPPSLASTALVVLPENTPDMSTQVVIASSDPVLSAASSSQRLGLTAEALRSKVQVKTPTSNIISITVKGGTAVQAEDMANAVANSYISFVTTRGNPGGTVQARMLQAASPGTGTPLPVYLLITAVLGALVGAVVGIVIALGVGRKDRRLRTRDEIADAVGIPVLASVPAPQPGSPAAWMKLLDSYEPDVVHAWRLRQALYDSIGIPTVLEVRPQQNPNLATALRAACAAPSAGRSKRWEHLRLTAGDSDDADQHAGGQLTIVVVVVDATDPQVVRTRRTAVTSLSVSAGLVTAEQLASVAASTADDGRRLTGIFVANPEPTDHTTGRLPRLRRPRPRLMPARLSRTMTETKR
jgi:capsular polysaccharide biosynthesis protein